ncbi:MAG: hypothetical protein FD155_2351 [Bacteroidetes bacterium]|nr:MAG: hypothetical protein FD155_2351 [Bacteroidota bacterium]
MSQVEPNETSKALKNDLEEDLQQFIDKKQNEKQALIKLLNFVEKQGKSKANSKSSSKSDNSTIL